MNQNGYEIRAIPGLPVSGFARLLEESRREGFRHIGRLADDYEAGINRFDREGEALFAAFEQGAIVGVCGLNRDPYLQERWGRVRRLYVLRQFRRRGIARSLSDAVLKEAALHYRGVVLRTDHPAADKFYRSLGFVRSSRYEGATHYLLFAREETEPEEGERRGYD